MKVIIAEKPSLARNIASTIGNMKRKDGYLEGNEYFVTWAFGHLFSLCDVEDYQDYSTENRYWTMDNLPCFPKEFQFDLKKDKNKTVDSGVKKQFDTIASLCNRQDVDTIINAGDSDREGEIIVRICIMKSGKLQKNFKRLWLPDQTSETITEALNDLKDETEYDNLANEGFARTYVDWLYGVNLTRYATLKTGSLMRIGRVIVPIVKAIYDRDKAISNFVSEPYYSPLSKTTVNGEEVELLSKDKYKQNEHQKGVEKCNLFNSHKAVVKSVSTKKDSIQPGKLYSLSKLQNVLGKKFKMSMDESLNIVQTLYEKGYVTYPRTNSEYLATAEKEKIKEIISIVAKLGYPITFKDKKTIFDDSKIESHSALTPTRKIPSPDALSPNEKIVYSAIMRRFVAVFCTEECKLSKTEIVIDVGGIEIFNVKGMVILEPGWTKYDDYNRKDKVVPKLSKGDEFDVNFCLTEKHTNPPKHYTIETLNNYLKNPFREEKSNAENEDDTEEYKAMFEGLELGTEATRTSIIQNAIDSGYIQLKKDTYTILRGGEELIESVARMNINMDKFKTAELGKALKKVYKNEYTVQECVILAQNEIKKVFEPKTVLPAEDTDDGFVGDEIGKCPLCQNTVVRTSFGYGCKGYKENGCRFAVSRIICSRVIPKSAVKNLIENKKTQKLNGFVSPKTGKQFDAFLALEDGRTKFMF